MAESESKSSRLQKAHADAYKAYLRSLKDSLASIDIEAIDLSKPQLVGSQPALYTFYTYYTYYTYHSFHTFHTAGTVGTESSIE